MARPRLSLAELYALADREFKRLREAASAPLLDKLVPGHRSVGLLSWCQKCTIPMPRSIAPGTGRFGSNWAIDDPALCPELCHAFVQRALEPLQRTYDVEERQQMQ